MNFDKKKRPAASIKKVTKKARYLYKKKAAESLMYEEECPETVQDMKEKEEIHFTPEALNQEVRLQDAFNDTMMILLTRLLRVCTNDPSATIKLETSHEYYGSNCGDIEYVISVGKKTFSMNKLLLGFQKMCQNKDAKNACKSIADDHLHMIQAYDRLKMGEALLSVRKK